MIIAFGGKHGSGKSSVGKPLAKMLGFKHYSAGDFMRQMAEERHITLLDMVRIAEKDPSVNEEIDRRTTELGKREDNFIIDGLLAFHFIPHAVKIFFDVSFDEAAKRIFHDKERKERYATVDDTRDTLKKRVASERKQLMSTYGVDPYDMKNFDLVVDTSGKKKEDIAKFVYEYIQRKKK